MKTFRIFHGAFAWNEHVFFKMSAFEQEGNMMNLHANYCFKHTHTHKKNQLVTSTNEVLRLNHSKPLDNTRNADMQTNILSDCLS